MNTAEQDRIEAGQALVHSLAAKIHRTLPSHVDLDDLIGYGELGLAEAARDFRPEIGCQFTTFAYYRIRGAIYDGLSKMTWTSRRRYARHRFEQLAGEALSEADQLADRSGATAAEGAAWLGAVSSKLTVVYFTTREEGGVRESSIEDAGASVDTLVAHREIGQQLRQFIDQLPEAERRLVQAVYFDGITMQAAATEMGLSKSWASRLHARALERLAQSLRKAGVENVAD